MDVISTIKFGFYFFQLLPKKKKKERANCLIGICQCGGVKPGPMIWAQEQRFINNTPKEKKS